MNERRANMLDKASLSRAGRGAPVSTWVTIAAGVALAAGVVWFGAALVRPMPAPVGAESAAPPTIAEAPFESTTAVERAALLSELDGMGNIFAPDREAWPEAALAETPDESEAEGAAVAPPPVTPTASTAQSRPPAYHEIEVEETPPPAIGRELQQIHLRGIYSTPRGVAAMIQDAAETTARGRAQMLGPGQSFRNGDWRVVAIDVPSRSVILSRAGVNVEVSLYDLPAGAAQVKRPVAQPAPPSVVVRTRTLEQARADLLAAGISEAEVDELLRLSQEAPVNPAVAATPEPAAPALDSAPGVSEDMRALLKMMAEGVDPTGGEKKKSREREKPKPDGAH